MKTETLLLLALVGGGAYFLLFRKQEAVKVASAPAPVQNNPQGGNTQEAGMAFFEDILGAITSIVGAVNSSSSNAQTSGQRN